MLEANCAISVLIGTSLALTQDGLHGHPKETLDVALLVHDRDPVDQRDRVGQVGQVDVGATDQTEPVKVELNYLMFPCADGGEE